MTAVVNTLRLAVVATLIGFVLGSLFGCGGLLPQLRDGPPVLRAVGAGRQRALLAGHGMVIIFSSQLMWLPPRAQGLRLGRLGLGSAHVQFMIPPAITMSVIPMGIIARTVRALVAELLDQEFIVGLKAN